MTRKIAGHNLLREESAETSFYETHPVTKDGPERFFEGEPVSQFEDHRIKAPYTNSANTSNRSKTKNFRKFNDETEISGSGRGTILDSPRVKQGHLTLKPSRFGSPLAYESYQNKHDFFKGLLSKNTRVLFDQVVTEASTLRERLSKEPAFTNNGRKSYFCALVDRESSSIDSDLDEESDSGESKLQLHCFGPNDDRLRLPPSNDVESKDSSSPVTGETSNADSTLEARRLTNSETGEDEYFIENKGLAIFYVNSISVGPAVTAGPLPDFVVFELAQSSWFWWRTVTALDYMPSFKRKRDSEDNNGGPSRKAFKGDTDPSPTLQVSPDSRNWLHEYRRRLKLCEKRPIKFTSSITDLHPPHQFPTGELHNTDVILAIGAVWLGLIEANVDFAYANSDFFSFARSMRMVGMHAVKETNHFLMPLLFNEELQALSPESEEDTAEPLEPVFSAFQRGEEEKHQGNFAAVEKAKQKDPGNKNKPPPSLEDQAVQNKNHKGGIGHFMLAIAEKVNGDQPNTDKDIIAKKALVRLRFMDSANGVVDKGLIRRVARNTVRNAGWLGDLWPRFDATQECWEHVLEQSGNRCGEHTVLNAWAYMLGIPLASKRDRALGISSYREVRKMIILALRGQLDSLTIRAWMQYSKYAKDEPLSRLQQIHSQKPDLPNMQTVALNEDAFNEIVNEMYTREQVEKQSRRKDCSAIPVTPDGATNRMTHKSGHFPKIDTRVLVPPSSQDPVASSSSAHNTRPKATGPASRFSLAQASIRPPKTWQERFNQGVAINIHLKAESPRTTQDARKNATIIRSSSNMADYDVVLGIAPIWEGLKRLGRADVDFTYAGMDIFSPGGGQRIVGAVGTWSRFIMPLMLCPGDAEELENQRKGEQETEDVGHLVLCVAELVNDQPMTVQLEVFDSKPNTVDLQVILSEAKRIIDISGWLGKNVHPTQVIYRSGILRPTPEQVGINTCGLHVILNAWAYMLGIPIHPGLLRRGRTEEDLDETTDNTFLSQGLGIVNLALQGFMESATIQAFFNTHGYSVEQRFGDPARAVIPVTAVGMNQEKLLRTLQARQVRDKLASARNEDKKFPIEDTAYLTGEGLSEDQAWRALVVADGNREEAFDWHFGWDDFGEVPKPEDALSPKTPD